MYIDYRNHVVSYHLLSGETISTSTLRIGFGEYLNQNHAGEDFVQCHESVAVNIRSIDKLTKTEIMVRNHQFYRHRSAIGSRRFSDYLSFRIYAEKLL